MRSHLILGAFVAASLPAHLIAQGGDPAKADFTLDFEEALAKAEAENKLLLIKPIYGGVDALGKKDYRCGSW